MPYHTWAEVVAFCKQSAKVKESARRMSRIHGGAEADEPFVEGSDSVSLDNMVGDAVIALYDGYYEHQFRARNHGVSPQYANVQGFHITHPRTRQPTVVYIQESDPAFRTEAREFWSTRSS